MLLLVFIQFNTFFVKNSVIDGEYLVYRDYYDLSVAVATPRGLVVPVIRDCDKKSFAGISILAAVYIFN